MFQNFSFNLNHNVLVKLNGDRAIEYWRDEHNRRLPPVGSIKKVTLIELARRIHEDGYVVMPFSEFMEIFGGPGVNRDLFDFNILLPEQNLKSIPVPEIAEEKSTLFVHPENIAVAIETAIAIREELEKRQGMTGDSGLLTGWRMTLEALRKGRPVAFYPKS